MRKLLKLLGWLVLLAIVAVAAFVAYPYMHDKVAGPPPASANLSDLRSLNTALHTYQKAYGRYPDSLAQLGVGKSGPSSELAAGLLGSKLAKGESHGYAYTYAKTAKGYEIHGDPTTAGIDVHLFTDESSEIRMNRKSPAGRDSAVVR